MITTAPAIVVTGNIASGKSTLCAGLVRTLPGYTYACVDRIRVQLASQGHTGMLAEHAAAAKLMDLVQGAWPLLYESSGSTQLYRRAIRHIRGYRRGPVVTIRTTCTRATAMHRFRSRKASGHKQMAPSFPGALPVEECWYRFEDMLRGNVDLLIDTERHNPAETLDLAIAHIRERIPQFPVAT